MWLRIGIFILSFCCGYLWAMYCDIKNHSIGVLVLGTVIGSLVFGAILLGLP